MKTILLPTDFSPAAKAASKFVEHLAKQFNSTVILLHVVESVDEASFNIEGEAVAEGSIEDRLFNLQMIRKGRTDLSNAASALEKNGVNVIPLLRVGDAYHGIETIIGEQNADLVIMGSEADGDLANMFVGSTAERTIRRAKCPVITVNGNTQFESLRSIVWATSLKNEDLEIPRVLKDMITVADIKVHLLRVNTPSVFMTDGVSKNKLTALAESKKFKSYVSDVFNDNEESRGIVQYSSNVDADMIVVSTHGRHGLSYLLNGSIAEDVINHTMRPVMTFTLGQDNV